MIKMDHGALKESMTILHVSRRREIIIIIKLRLISPLLDGDYNINATYGSAES